MPLDVLLVNPNRMQPPIAPLALEYLATALEQAGLSCAVTDLCFADDPEAALAADLSTHDPRLVAITLRNSDDCYRATQHCGPGSASSLGEIVAPATTVLLGHGNYTLPYFEFAQGCIIQAAYYYRTRVHNDGGNYGFCDGHAKWYKPQSVLAPVNMLTILATD